MTQSDREFHIFEVGAGKFSGIFRLGVEIGEGILGLDRKDQWASQAPVCQILDGKMSDDRLHVRIWPHPPNPISMSITPRR